MLSPGNAQASVKRWSAVKVRPVTLPLPALEPAHWGVDGELEAVHGVPVLSGGFVDHVRSVTSVPSPAVMVGVSVTVL
jgi:hypothetical protein